MQLKRFQERVLQAARAFLETLVAEQTTGNRHAALDAWERCRLLSRYTERRNGVGRDLPTFCIKVPTGGGKMVFARLSSVPNRLG